MHCLVCGQPVAAARLAIAERYMVVEDCADCGARATDGKLKYVPGSEPRPRFFKTGEWAFADGALGPHLFGAGWGEMTEGVKWLGHQGRGVLNLALERPITNPAMLSVKVAAAKREGVEGPLKFTVHLENLNLGFHEINAPGELAVTAPLPAEALLHKTRLCVELMVHPSIAARFPPLPGQADPGIGLKALMIGVDGAGEKGT